jgi:TatD DNase family protein
MLIDTHCHIHEPMFEPDSNEAISRAREAGVTQLLCVGTSEESSRQAIAFAAEHENVFATVGVHPHDTKDGYEAVAELAAAKKVVAIGEVGLDYFYGHSPRETQIEALKFQLAVAQHYNLPVVFHVREAFDDFWPIFDSFAGLRGVLHSFTDSAENLQQALARGLFIGVNGISTFTKDDAQKAMFDSIPLENMLLETDAPFLTPAPFRGKINEPAFVRIVADYHAERRGISVDTIAEQTTANAQTLFSF